MKRLEGKYKENKFPQTPGCTSERKREGVRGLNVPVSSSVPDKPAEKKEQGGGLASKTEWDQVLVQIEALKCLCKVTIAKENEGRLRGKTKN